MIGLLAAIGFGILAAPDSAGERLYSVAGYSCADVSCKRLSSCEEACYKLLVCGQSKRDADNDGIPCENLCSKPCER